MADDVDTDNKFEDHILYELTIHAEWPLDTEVIHRSSKDKLQNASSGSLWSVLKTAYPLNSGSPSSLPAGLVKLVTSHLNWHLAISQDGTKVAVLQDQCLEIRSSHDDYGSVVGKYRLSYDPHPQWRRVVWSPGSDMVAFCDSAGQVQVIDTFGTPVCTIAGRSTTSASGLYNLSVANAALITKEHKGKGEWSFELLTVNYDGYLCCYGIGRDGDFKLLHRYSFRQEYPRGISAALYSQQHNLLLVGGAAELHNVQDPETARQTGLSAWRLISDFPHYKLITDYDEDSKRARSKSRIVQKLWSRWYGEVQDGVYQMSMSPDSSLLATISYRGNLHLWEVPSLRMRKSWSQEQQPDSEDVNPKIAENPHRRKAMRDLMPTHTLIDSSWWTDDHVILGRGTGAVSICSTDTLQNHLGSSPEWFEPNPIVSMTHDGRFLGLECEYKFNLKRRHVDDEDDEYEDTDDEEDMNAVTRSSRWLKRNINDIMLSEVFKLPKKRPRLVSKTYKLFCFKSTTPEELYARQIEEGAYGEALALAKAYGLDCDLVYQRRWRNTPVSVASITDYLSKISKRSWVLHECLERVPENIDAMRELLQYGLRGTDLEALIAIGEGKDGGRFILCDRHDVYEESIDDFLLHEEQEIRRKELQEKKEKELLEKIDFTRLTLEQRELCRARTRLLQYLDRLSTYEEILGGINFAEERFNPKFFEKFRSKNIVEVAVDYARNCDWKALDTLIMYHGDALLPHRLAVLSNFPETFSPFDFRYLLPAAGSGSPDTEPVVSVEQCEWREADWVEKPNVRKVIDPSPVDPGAFLYEENPDYEKFRGTPLTKEQLTEWYIQRACEIESFSRQVDNARELVKLGMDNYVRGLNDLYDDLVTMETLVYECYVDDSVTLEDLRKMTNINKLQMLMSKSCDEMYKKHLYQWLVPFLNQCERRERGSYNKLIREFMVSMAQEELILCVHVFECSKEEQPNRIVASDVMLMELALDCIYTCESNDQLSNAYCILECLPKREYVAPTSKANNLQDSVDELEHHLRAAEIFENNSCPQTIVHIRDTQDSPEEARNLITKLTRQAGRRDPAMSEAQWKKLLRDLLDLQEGCYHCLSLEECYQIFVESLLCSSRAENIRLAGQFLQARRDDSGFSRSISMEQYQLPDYRLPYQQSVELVLLAAREYFDSSASLSDTCMDLARACLTLMSERTGEITEELELIESLTVLKQFGVEILPLQVRMCQDRLSLIQKAINSSSDAYKNYQRLLKLGALLRVHGDKVKMREGSILQLVTRGALSDDDLRLALSMCERLMEEGYAPVWAECKELAEREDFHNIQAKAELLSFAVAHCSPEMIEPILRAKCLLDTQLLYERVHAECHEGQSPARISPFSATGAIKQTKEILSSTTKTTRKVLSTVSNTSFWQKTLRNLHPLRQQGQYHEFDDHNVKMDKQGCHPFYGSVVKGAYVNRSEADYSNMKIPQRSNASLQFSESVLRASQLEETLTEGEAIQPTTEVLIQLAKDTIAQDTTLGLAYLLALPKVLDAEVCLKHMPRTAVSLQVATYYYALRVYAGLDNLSQPQQKEIYQHPPAKVVDHVICQVTSSKSDDWSEDVKEAVDKLKYYSELLADFNQAQVLQALGKGVDVARFTKDQEYKHETILGLAMTLEDPVYEISVSLAKRYQLPLWDIYMTHLEFLFDCGIPTQELEKRVGKLAILPTLRGQSEDFCDRMRKCVYPTIAGSDHDRLSMYFNLLEGCHPEGQVAPSVHIKLLKKIKPAAPGLDYKSLIDGKRNPLEVIRPVLNSSNVHVLAKLAPRMPSKDGGSLQPSVVFCAWAIKQFWDGDQGNKKTPKTTSEWVHRYESCGEYLQKMVAGDVVQFIDGITFVSEALDKLEMDCRHELVRRAQKYCRQQEGKKGKSEDTSKMTWREAVEHLQLSLNHLDLMNNDVVMTMQASESEQTREYARQLDLTRGQTDRMQNLLVGMVLDGQSPENLEDVLDVIPMETWTPRTAIMEALQLLCQALRSEDDASDLIKDRDTSDTMLKVISQVKEHQGAGGDLVSQEDVMGLLRPFCADTAVPVHSRLEVLKILEQSFSLDEGDLSVLILYRTRAIVSEAWPGREVAETEVSVDEDRHTLFSSLLEDCTSIRQFLAVQSLLQVWPALSKSSDGEEEPSVHPWYRLVQRLLEVVPDVGRSCVVQVVKDMQQPEPPGEKVMKKIYKTVLSADLILQAVKCALVTGHTELHQVAAQELANMDQAEDDDELMLLLLKCGLVSQLVETVYYSKLVQYVLANQPPGGDPPYYLSVDTICNQLKESGYEAEAGSLLLKYRGTHPAVQTFDTALAFIKKWMPS